MSERADERLDELIALSASGELSESDELELDALLADDVELASEVDGTMETAAMLHGALAEEPPAQLKSSVLDAIADVPQVPPIRNDQLFESEDRVVDLASRRRRRWAPVLSVAAGLVLLAGAATVFVRGDSTPSDDEVVAEAVTDADDAVARVLEGELDGTVTVVYSPGESAIVIDGAGLPVLGEDRAFVLWFVDDDGATPVRTFRPDGAGDVLVRVDGVDPTDVTLGITEEAADGADVPTLPILAAS